MKWIAIAVALSILIYGSCSVLAQTVDPVWNTPVAKTKDGWTIWLTKYSQYGCRASSYKGGDDWFRIEGFTPDELRFVWVMTEELATKFAGESYVSSKPPTLRRDWSGVVIRMSDKKIPGYANRNMPDVRGWPEIWRRLENFGEYGAAGFEISVTPRFLNFFTGAKEIQIITFGPYPVDVLRTKKLKGSKEAVEELFKCFETQGYTFDGYKYQK